ncbi:tRNA (guanosine(37)-N1)-methyltransferase TrmD [Candidatus Gottesmanbacteria bacterium]|nr:tRNA (guanosine(37)-N1)-methyltransferase TrmD [Candidatus Gottesmanbacteria bacterium]
MTITVISLFPEMFTPLLSLSILGRAQKKNFVNIKLVNLRDYATDKHKSVDDTPYGGGVGMILRVDVVDRAISEVLKRSKNLKSWSILLDPQGTTYTQKKAKSLTKYEHLILLCGHYEGVDERIRSLFDEEISLGDFILTGGEIPAMAIVDSIVRLLPGVLEKENVTENESFSLRSSDSNGSLLEYPHYTKPSEYKGLKVPEILLNGHHKHIEEWRGQQSMERTKKRRPDLLKTSHES